MPLCLRKICYHLAHVENESSFKCKLAVQHGKAGLMHKALFSHKAVQSPLQEETTLKKYFTDVLLHETEMFLR